VCPRFVRELLLQCKTGLVDSEISAVNIGVNWGVLVALPDWILAPGSPANGTMGRQACKAQTGEFGRLIRRMMPTGVTGTFRIRMAETKIAIQKTRSSRDLIKRSCQRIGARKIRTVANQSGSRPLSSR
jgi:hypothetical protein